MHMEANCKVTYFNGSLGHTASFTTRSYKYLLLIKLNIQIIILWAYLMDARISCTLYRIAWKRSDSGFEPFLSQCMYRPFMGPLCPLSWGPCHGVHVPIIKFPDCPILRFLTSSGAKTKGPKQEHLSVAEASHSHKT
jgi:hypothetical protein